MNRLIGRSVLLVCLVAQGCVMIHGQRNAPGHVQVESVPRANRVSCAEPEIPDDPGERYFTVATGVAFAGGPSFSREDNIDGLYVLSVETSLHLGDRDRSHRDDKSMIPGADEKYWPHRSLALNLGWHVLERQGDGPGVGAGYAELQLFSMKLFASGVAAGWAYHPDAQDHGPQITLFTMGFMFLRVNHLMDRGTDIQLGVQFKIPISYVWSR